MKRETYITIAIVLLGWIGSGIWLVSEMRSEIRSLERDLARIETQNKELNDKMWVIMSQNGDKRSTWFDRSLEAK